MCTAVHDGSPGVIRGCRMLRISSPRQPPLSCRFIDSSGGRAARSVPSEALIPVSSNHDWQNSSLAKRGICRPVGWHEHAGTTCQWLRTDFVLSELFYSLQGLHQCEACALGLCKQLTITFGASTPSAPPSTAPFLPKSSMNCRLRHNAISHFRTLSWSSQALSVADSANCTVLKVGL